MHNAAIEALGLDFVYVPFDVAPENIRQAMDGIRALGIAGVNVTIPHKEAVIPFLDEVEDDAGRIGSVNTIANVGGRLIGSSTDGQGFMKPLIEAGFDPNGRKALVIGAGGAGRAVTFALARAGAEVVVMLASSERIERLVRDVQGAVVGDVERGHLAERLREADLLVNCTPVGMHPKDDRTPVPSELLRSDLFVYDLVYNPLKTKLLEDAESAGARALGGMKMLVYQGAISFKTWTGIDPPVDVMEAAALGAR
jgi:shikimate dehydrogenase